MTPPTSLLPSPNGNLIALTSNDYVSVMVLRRSRGPYGEFSGGNRESDCRTLAIGNTIIRAHCLNVIQVQWCPNMDSTIAVLTSDEKLRLYTITEPNIPLLCVNTSLNATSHALKLPDEKTMCFSFYNDMLFLLQDQLSVQTLTLREGSLPSMPLPMYPLMNDNYEEEGCGLLVLPTTPPVLVLASTGGRIRHCVYSNGIEEVYTM